MSVIHDALEKGTRKKPASQLYPVLLPDVTPSAVLPKKKIRRKIVVAWKPVNFRHGRLILIALIFGAAGFFAALFLNVPSPDSSPKSEAASSQSSAVSRMDVFPAINRKAAAHDFHLTGIVEGADPLALINNQTVRIGDRIQRALVKEIQGRRVILEFQGRDIILSLQEA